MAAMLMAGCMLAMTLNVPARAGEKKSKADIEAEKAEQALKLLAASGAAAEFGRAEKAPEALITAGGMLLKARTLAGEPREYKEPVEDKEGKKLDVPAEPVVPLDKQAAALFEEARDLAKTSAEANALNALIKATEARYKEKSRAAITPLQTTRKIGAGGDHYYTVKFETKSPASVSFTSTHNIRFKIFEPGVGQIFELVGTNGHYHWSPRGPGGTKNIRIEVHGTNKMATYTVYAK
jgi:hypothetical protein